MSPSDITFLLDRILSAARSRSGDRLLFQRRAGHCETRHRQPALSSKHFNCVSQGARSGRRRSNSLQLLLFARLHRIAARLHRQQFRIYYRLWPPLHFVDDSIDTDINKHFLPTLSRFALAFDRNADGRPSALAPLPMLSIAL